MTTIALVDITNNATSAPPITLALVMTPPDAVITRGTTFGAAGNPTLQLVANGGTGGYTYATSTLAGTGLTLNAATGAITGTPAAIGTIAFTATATDSSSNSTPSVPFNVVVKTRLSLSKDTPANPPEANYNIAVNYAWRVDGATGTVTWTQAGSILGFLTFSSVPPQGLLQGTDVNSVTASATAVITATDSGTGDTLTFFATQTFTGLASCSPSFSLPSIEVNVPFSYTYTVIRGKPPLHIVSSSGVPSWMSVVINDTTPPTFTVSGTPPASLYPLASQTVSPVTVTMQDAQNNPVGQAIISATFTITNAGANQPKKNGVAVGVNKAGLAYDYSFVNGATSGPDVTNNSSTATISIPVAPLLRARLATAATLPANTYANGTLGVGATLTANATGTLTIDGVLVALNDVVLVRSEVSVAKNGVYICTTAGAVGVAYVLTRHPLLDEAAEFPGAICSVGPEGTANAKTFWVCSPTPPVTVGTTLILWAQIGAVQAPQSFPLTRVTSSATLVSDNNYSIGASGQTWTLPASPAAGDQIGLFHEAGITSTINPNGNPISGRTGPTAGNMTMSLPGFSFTMTFVDATRGWLIT